MKKWIGLAVVLFFAGRVMAFDLNVNDAVKKVNTDDAMKKAGDAATDSAMAEITKKLKNVQNEHGPIIFKNGKATLEVKKCEETLKAIHRIVHDYPGFLVQVEGHTDNKGKAAKNMELSQKRAEAVVAYLVNTMKTDASRLKAKGFGDTVPIADNKTAKGREKNRRVDFSVTKL